MLNKSVLQSVHLSVCAQCPVAKQIVSQLVHNSAVLHWDLSQAFGRIGSHPEGAMGCGKSPVSQTWGQAADHHVTAAAMQGTVQAAGTGGECSLCLPSAAELIHEVFQKQIQEYRH